MAEEQLSWIFDSDVTEYCEEPSTDEIAQNASQFAEEELLKEATKLPEPGLHQCSHKVVFRACRKGYATYCNKCGKILSVRNRK